MGHFAKHQLNLRKHHCKNQLGISIYRILPSVLEKYLKYKIKYNKLFKYIGGMQQSKDGSVSTTETITELKQSSLLAEIHSNFFKYGQKVVTLKLSNPKNTSQYQLILSEVENELKQGEVEITGNDKEKINVFNGLPLSPNAEKIFELGLISFDENGKLIKSNKLSDEDLKKLNINSDIKLDFKSDHFKYLEYHRLNQY